MNYIQFPTIDGIEIDDYATIFKLARNSRLASFPSILEDEAEIIGAYVAYSLAGGDATKLASCNLQCSGDLKELYKTTYRSTPPKEIAHLKKHRENENDKVCPMCGSLGRGTLDHVLPQAQFPEYAIFSPNLVPACRCNSLRQEVTVGPNGMDRVLHPYFDAILSERLISIQIAPPYHCPAISLLPALPKKHPLYGSVKFHLTEVVMKTAIRNRMDTLWAKTLRKPSLVLPKLPDGQIDLTIISGVVNDEILRLDELFESKNNWDSIFVSGLKDQGVLQFLLDRINNMQPLFVAGLAPSDANVAM